MKRVAHILRSQAWGGLELYTLELLTKLDQGISPIPATNCVLICHKNSRVSREAKSRGIDIVETQNGFSAFLELSRGLQKGKYQGVHVHRRQDLFVARIVLSFFNTPFFYSLYMMAAPKRDFYHRWIYQRLSAVFTSSTWVQQQMQKHFPMPPHRSVLLRYGREPTAPPPPNRRREIRNQYGVLPGQIVFGTACRIDPGKGLRELGYALELIPDPVRSQIQLWIIGEPTLKRTLPDGSPEYETPSAELQIWLGELANRFPNTLKLIGFQKNLSEYLGSMDVFILASLGETYSLSVVDAMMLALPVIGTDSGGTTEQIGPHEERGLLVPPKDAESLAKAIEKMSQDSKPRTEKGERAKSWSQSEHSWKKTLQELHYHYDRSEKKNQSGDFDK